MASVLFNTQIHQPHILRYSFLPAALLRQTTLDPARSRMLPLAVLRKIFPLLTMENYPRHWINPKLLLTVGVFPGMELYTF